MSQVRVLSVDSVVPIKRISSDLISWTQKDETELASYNSNLDILYQEIERYQTAEELNNSNNPPPDNDDDNQGGLDWLDDNKEKGEKGERLALAYLENNYKQVRSVSHIASKGYDIEVLCEKTNTILGFEIKTSVTENKFFITYNELGKANRMKDNYFLFFIYFQEDKNESYAYIIQNPLQELQIDFLKLTEPIQTDKATVIPSQFRISMDLEYLEKLDKKYL
ncbi:hypothetical protein BTO30_09625 [Domibacillus antri]|uniref:Protein NO VEIN C-terminal domain-containing protein n=1 Tax=Domibacillus antri TaxID=1714264 RepID=A0A1Q8Q5I2_9BACI|nr:DUF3883 domain-containing protein [Domibacillus antri]OLN22552.1 hypothetical protein BTO30_09625 [Domibacillus antri]